MITRNNYEEFFLLYVDNELSPAERQAVEGFVEAHPDLREEWELLMQCRVSPDDAPVFAGKDLLMRAEDPSLTGDDTSLVDHNTPLIDLNNYETWFLSYIDGELDEPARQAVLGFVRLHPDKAVELQQLQRTVNIPDKTLVFPDKTILYRREQPKKIAWLPFVRIAAAALVLGAIGVAVFYPSRNTSSGADPLAAGKKSSATDKVTSTPGGIVSAPDKGVSAPAPALAGPDHSGQNPVRVPGNETTTSVQPAVKNQFATVTPRIADTLHLNKSNLPSGNELPVHAEPTTAPVLAKVDVHLPDNIRGSDRAIASIKTPPATGDPIGNTEPTGKVIVPDPKTSFATQALLSHTVAYTEDGSVEEMAAPRKNKLRGIFRKVTRALEKPASREDDEDKKVLIGGFQIALQ